MHGRLFGTVSTASAVGKSLKLMFLGAPGAGKGTYAGRIAPLFNIPTISTGDLVRNEIKHATPLGDEIRRFNDRGMLVPDEIIMRMVRKRLEQDDTTRGFLMDGFPRNLSQAESFAQISDFDLVVNIDLPEWILIEKISGRRVCSNCGHGFNICHINSGKYQMPPLLPKVPGICDTCGHDHLEQRPDDTEEVVKKRLAVYTKETAPLIEFYHQQGCLHNFPVIKGLGDLDRLIDLIKTKLHI